MEGLPVGDYLVYLRRSGGIPAGGCGGDRREAGVPMLCQTGQYGFERELAKLVAGKNLQSAMEKAAMYDRKLVIEAFLEGRG